MIVLFDFDEVLVDINTNALKYINNKLGTTYNYEDIVTWDFFNTPEMKPIFYEYLEKDDMYQKQAIPNKEMIGVLKSLVDMNFQVYIVTASVEKSHPSKHRFIQDHLSFMNQDNIFVVNSSSAFKDKSDVLNHLNLSYHEPIVLVDDGIHNILDFMADIKHKEKLDDTMSQFYKGVTLKKFNNPYHDFVYGVIPELAYNRDIKDGKRIFKLRKPKDIWNIFKNIEASHNGRIVEKQSEIFAYFYNILEDKIEAEDLKSSEKIINNSVYMIKRCLKNTSHLDFVDNAVGLSVIFDKLTAECKSNAEILEVLDDVVFKYAEKEFGSNVMYQDIKVLLLSSVLKDGFDDIKGTEMTELMSSGKVVEEFYGMTTKGGNILNKIKGIAANHVKSIDDFVDGLISGKLDVENVKRRISFFDDSVPSSLSDFFEGKNVDAALIKTNLNMLFAKNYTVKNNKVVTFNGFIGELFSEINKISQPSKTKANRLKVV